MVGQELDENRPDEEPPKLTGVKLPEDDLNVGDFVCVYNLKRTDDGAPIMGQSLEVKAVCLPYFVGKLLSDPAEPVLTLDCRFLNLMRVTKEFVDAQKEGAQQQAAQQGQQMMQPKKRRQAKEEGP